MLRKLALLSALFVATFTLFGCEDDPASPDEDHFHATIDGDDEESTDVAIVAAGNTLDITGTLTSGEIHLVIEGVTGEEAITLPSDRVTATYTAGGTIYTATSGSVEIDDYTAGSSVSGTFEFDAANGATTKEITDGEFSGRIQ